VHDDKYEQGSAYSYAKGGKPPIIHPDRGLVLKETFNRTRIYEVSPAPEEIPLSVNFDDTIGLTKAWVFSRSAPASGVAAVALSFRNLAQPRQEYSVFVHLNDVNGNTVAQRDLPYKKELSWTLGDEHTLFFGIPLPAGLEQIATEIAVGVYRSQDLGRLPVKDSQIGLVLGDSVSLGAFRIGGSGKVAAPQERRSVSLGNPVELLGYDLPQRTAVPGDEVRLTLYWRAKVQIEEDYTVFVHLVDNSGLLVAQGDAVPRQGNYPTTAWEPGEDVADWHRVRIPKGLASGRYRLLVGLYLPSTLQRLPVDGQKVDFIDLGFVEVK